MFFVQKQNRNQREPGKLPVKFGKARTKDVSQIQELHFTLSLSSLYLPASSLSRSTSFPFSSYSCFLCFLLLFFPCICLIFYSFLFLLVAYLVFVCSLLFASLSLSLSLCLSLAHEIEHPKKPVSFFQTARSEVKTPIENTSCRSSNYLKFANRSPCTDHRGRRGRSEDHTILATGRP